MSVVESIPQTFWATSFIKEQEIKSEYGKMNQDNKSVILVETNKIFSSSKRMRHINV